MRATRRTDLGRRLGRRGGDASSQRGDAGANSGEATGGDGRHGVDTDGTGTKLTSWRSSGRAPRRCSGGDGEGPRRRCGLGFRVHAAQEEAALVLG
jgi:hypothetical protein